MRSRHNAQVNLQRRHFEYIAKTIANLPNSVDRQLVAEHFANWLWQTNPQFKSDKFVQWAMGDTRTESDIARVEKAKLANLAKPLKDIEKAQALVEKLGG